MSELTDRIRKAVDGRFGGNWAELARRADMNLSTLQHVKDGADPRASTLGKIARALQVSSDWLIAGDGDGPAFDDAPDEEGEGDLLAELMRDPSEVAGAMARSRKRHGVLDALRPDLDKEAATLPWSKGVALAMPGIKEMDWHSLGLSDSDAAQLLSDLGLGGVALLARGSRQLQGWRLLLPLARAYPEALEMEAINGASRPSSTEATEARMELARLAMSGLVEILPGPPVRYRAATASSTVSSSQRDDMAQHLIEAVRLLARDIRPAAERGSGQVISCVLNVPTGRGRDVTSHIVSVLKDAWGAEIGESDTAEEVTVVLGVALTRLNSP